MENIDASFNSESQKSVIITWYDVTCQDVT